MNKPYNGAIMNKISHAVEKDYAVCHIHGKFYSGFPECPTCKAQDENIKGGGEENGSRNT